MQICVKSWVLLENKTKQKDIQTGQGYFPKHVHGWQISSYGKKIGRSNMSEKGSPYI